MTNKADSIGRPDAPEFGLHGYVPIISVYFKWEAEESEMRKQVETSDCEILAHYEYNDPVFDRFENDFYNLSCPDIDAVPENLKYFNWLESTIWAGADFQVIQQ